MEPVEPPKKRINSRYLRIAMMLTALVLLSFFGRYLYLKFRYPDQEILKGVPQSALMVAEGEGIGAFLDSLVSQPVWLQGFQVSGMPDHLGLIARELSDFSKEDESIAGWVQKEPFALSLVPRKENGPAFLVTVRLPKGLRPSAVHHFFRKHWTSYQEKKLLELRFYERVFPDGGQLFLAIKDGMLIGATDREAFELGYYTIGSGNHILNDKNFMEVREQLEKSQNRAVRVFISYEGMYTWMNRFIREDRKEPLALIPDLGYWGGFDLKTAGSLLCFQGFTGSVAPESKLREVLPDANTQLDDPGQVMPASVLFYDQMLLNSLVEHRKQYLEQYLYLREGKGGAAYPIAADTLQEIIARIDSFLPASLVNALVSTRDTTEGAQPVLWLQSYRANELLLNLSPFIDTLGRQQYQEFTYYPLRIEYLVPALFGPAYRQFIDPFVSVYKDYLVITPSQEVMLSILNQYSSGRILGVQNPYRELFQQVKGQMSRRIYFNRTEGEGYLKAVMRPEKADRFLATLPYLPGRMIVGIAKSGGTLLTDIAIHSDAEVSLPARGGEVLVDAPLVTAPLIIRDYRDNTRKVICADESGSLYLLNEKAGIEWKLNATEPPLSGLYAIDLYKNGRQQCLFMSKNMLHLVQIDGKYVPGFPVQLSTPFAAGLSVFDYEMNGNFRCLYYDSRGHLANVDLSGRQVAGWSYPEYASGGFRPEFLRAGGIDFLMHTGQEGDIHFLDRRGKEKFQLKQPAARSKQSDIVVVIKDGQPAFAWLDGSGALQVVGLDGSPAKGAPLKFDPMSWLVFDASGSGAMVVATPGELAVFDISLKPLHKSPLTIPLSLDVKPAVYHSGVLLTGKSNAHEPLMIIRPENKQKQPASYSVDYFSVWRSVSGTEGFGVLAKGRVLRFERL
ncbi:MAG TPA: hypothetical protein P5228_02510 [Bacteroidales bacterium]|nr:hypothetical protein [Bacteroidales bacterium]HRZ48571.1 hypothetical protein [Bacteroidales bacterium]